MPLPKSTVGGIEASFGERLGGLGRDDSTFLSVILLVIYSHLAASSTPIAGQRLKTITGSLPAIKDVLCLTHGSRLGNKDVKSKYVTRASHIRQSFQHLCSKYICQGLHRFACFFGPITLMTRGSSCRFDEVMIKNVVPFSHRTRFITGKSD